MLNYLYIIFNNYINFIIMNIIFYFYWNKTPVAFQIFSYFSHKPIHYLLIRKIKHS